MKKLAFLLTMLVFMNACQENEPVQQDLTGNESTYALVSGSTYPVNGTVTFQELKDGGIRIRVALSGTEGSIKHPVHLHLGNIATPDADVAALLNPVPGQTGISETTLKQLADESPITYQQLVQLNACIKIHLAESGPDKNIILAGGNVGTATSDDTSVGRIGMRVCKSE